MSGYVYPTGTTRVSDSFADHVARGSVNPGTDYVVTAGSDVFSIAAGRVVVADGSPDGSGGRTICVYHDDGSSADYLHLNALSVSVGQRVSQGQRIGFSGASGFGSNTYYGAHLHISFRPRTQIDWFGNAGNVDFDAVMRNAGTTAGNGATTIEEDDLNADQDNKLTQIYNAVFNGGVSMPDHGRSIGASLAGIVQVIDKINAIVSQPVQRSVNGKVVQISQIQELADAKTLALNLTAQVGALQQAVTAIATSQGVNPAAIRDAAQQGAAAALAGITLKAVPTGS